MKVFAKLLPQVRGLAATLAVAGLLSFGALACSSPESENAVSSADPVVGDLIGIEYTMRLRDGSEVATNVGERPLLFTLGGDEVFPALETAVSELDVGDTTELTLSPADAYGERDPEAVREVPVDLLPEDARKVGARMMAEDDAGNAIEVRVESIDDDIAVLDMNHPLAGQPVHMSVKVLSRKRPTESP